MRRSLTRLLVAVIAASALLVSPASADTSAPARASAESNVRYPWTPPAERYAKWRKKTVRTHGAHAAGRDIRKWGVRRGGTVHRATFRQIQRSTYQLIRINRPAGRYLTRRAVAPELAPGGVMSPGAAPTGLAACIVHHESRGNPDAVNGDHTGIGQWTPEAWERHGGHRFASSPLGATYQQQLVILNQGLERYGCRDWCPFDPC